MQLTRILDRCNEANLGGVIYSRTLQRSKATNARANRRKEVENVDLGKPSLYGLIKLPAQVVYVYATVLVGIVVMAITWFIFREIFLQVQAAGMDTMTRMGTDSATTDLVDSFFENLYQYFLALFLFALLLWAFFYSQRKGSPMGE